jgi:hypothetical protein
VTAQDVYPCPRSPAPVPCRSQGALSPSLVALRSPSRNRLPRSHHQPTAPTTTTTPPASVIGTPMTRPSAIAPLSPQQVTTTPVSGGTVRNDKLASPTASSISPSESAQSTAGGGGWGLKACMGYWDRGTHMTKSEWRGACERSARRLDNLKIDDLSLGLPTKQTPGRRRSHGPRPS